MQRAMRRIEKAAVFGKVFISVPAFSFDTLEDFLTFALP